MKATANGKHRGQPLAEIQLRSARKAGEFLAAMEKASGGEYGGRKPKDGCRLKPSNPTATLSDIGITKSQSHRWQTINATPEEQGA